MTSTSYPENVRDWRGRFIANLAAGLGRRNDLSLSLWAPPGELPSGVTDATPSAHKLWLRQMSQSGGIAHLLRRQPAQAAITTARLLLALRQVYRMQRIDIAHVNWLQNALPLYGTTTPAVISVLGTDFGLLRLPGMKALLRTVLRQRQAILAPNADWMVPELERHFGDIAQIRSVPFGIDTTWFAIKRQFLPRPPFNWLAVTRLTAKKIGDLFTWGEGKFGENRTLHLFGPMQEQVVLPPWVTYHGPTHPTELAVNWFPHACGLITLSRHDEGRPQVMLEAMASGLPIIASDLAAHRDIIRQGETGCLVSSEADFAIALATLENADANILTGERAKAWVHCQFGTWDNCAARYADLYMELMETCG